jgi:hypothetical protein
MSDVVGLVGRDLLNGGFVQSDGETNKVSDRQVVVGEGVTGTGVYGLKDDLTGLGGQLGSFLQWGAQLLGASEEEKNEEWSAESAVSHG